MQPKNSTTQLFKPLALSQIFLHRISRAILSCFPRSTSTDTDPSQKHQLQFPTMTIGSQDQGATGAAKWVTSTLGNTVGGVARTVGGVTGAATRGVGDTINSATGSAGRPVGDAIGNAGTGLEDGTKQVAKGVENAGQWKGQWR
jgi:hypothetical protein